jgi:hypothetical protein
VCILALQKKVCLRARACISRCISSLNMCVCVCVCAYVCVLAFLGNHFVCISLNRAACVLQCSKTCLCIISLIHRHKHPGKSPFSIQHIHLENDAHANHVGWLICIYLKILITHADIQVYRHACMHVNALASRTFCLLCVLVYVRVQTCGHRKAKCASRQHKHW